MQQEEKKCERCDMLISSADLACPLVCRRNEVCKTYLPGPIDTTLTPIIWILGPPRSGKTTVYQTIIAKYKYLGVVNKDIVAANANVDSQRRRCINSALKRGVSVPNDVVMDMIRDHLIKHSKNSPGFVFDNYPPERKDAQLFERIIAPVTAVIYIDASVQALVNRIMEGYKVDEITARRILNRYVEDTGSLRVEFVNKLHIINSEYSKEKVVEDLMVIMDKIFRQNDIQLLTASK